ncbi:MAG: glycosyltransferase family 2 protein [cyanobacterium endosymbiont of Rhopalodia musculus]|uniref:glycosyltransferase family 2 protein n=1 Tax=cyanobacterium endosymbiont of Epithemia clementina EcSB TaxID=3034674 RepID=UPI00247FC84A|nr:glycosyltransferase family 2 protein [cyanobacterium endosymbiont of Epithemia clementina EcSB]WGT67126.1 glycosyltransferase family 2 protein [cyanobacterium endosymbiont of Epithemia clementina EcSB]
MKLSIVIPVYNEIHTIESALTKVAQALPAISKEIVLVDDGSTDGTREWLVQTFGQVSSQMVKIKLDSNQQLIVQEEIECETHHPQSEVAASESLSVGVQVIFHKRNQGKGAALRTGFKAATGEVILIQDADLEYDPQDWKRMWRLIEEGWADVVYGSRFYGEPHRVLYFHHLLGNQVISNFINLLCNTTLTDIEVCTKMFRREVLDDIKLTCNDFGFEVEFTVKVAKSRRRWRLYEAGVSYYGRSYAEGKKINWTDGVKALWYTIRFWATT